MINARLRKAEQSIKRGEFEAARQLYQSILQQYPKNQAALQGMHALQQARIMGNLPPAQVDALNALYNRGQYQAALQQTQAMLKNYPKAAILYNMSGKIQFELRQGDQAAAHYQQALALAPDYTDAHNNFGILNEKCGYYDKALECYARVLQSDPACAAAYNNIGIVYNRMGQAEKALANYRKALQLDPNYLEAHVSLGALFNDMGEYHEALACGRRAIALKPDCAVAHANLGVTHSRLGNHQETLASYARAVQHDPQDAVSHFNYAYALLLVGDFRNGWQEYEWRPGGSKNRVETRGFTQPFWLGDRDINGKTILIHSEQGLGDTLQFSRYVKPVAELGATILFEVQEQLVPLFESFNSYAQIVPKDQELLPEFEVHCPLVSLPFVFATGLDSIPDDTGYLHVPLAKIKHWQTRLGERNRPRIGIVWRGNPKHSQVRRRSLLLAMVLQHLPPDYDYISLQYEVADEDRPLLSRLNHVGEDFTDFADTAAVCTQLDILISVDTSVAHLGGALGMPTWVLLPYSPEFRWLLDRSDSPWYPTARLFRQPDIDDWPSVLTAVSHALKEQFERD